jgi:hypothetical protein
VAMMKCFRLSAIVLAFLVHGGSTSGDRESKFLRKKGNRNLQRLTFRGSNPNFKLSKCEGDCDTDLDCISGLVCYQKNVGGTGAVPGCSGTDTSNTDFCFDRGKETQSGQWGAIIRSILGLTYLCICS